MEWPRGATVVWHPYRRTKSGNYLASLYMRLNYQGKQLPPRRFVFDSGAVHTIAPLEYAIDPLDLSRYPLRKTGMRDVHGNELEGIPVPLELEIEGQYPAEHIYLQETVWFCQKRPGSEGLLGQASAFEQLGIIFENFPDASAGRRFGLYLRPHSMETLSFHRPGTWLHEGTGTFSFSDHEFLILEGGPALYRYMGEVFADFNLEIGWYTESPHGKAGVCLRLPATSDIQPTDSTGIEIPIEAQSSDATWSGAASMPGTWNTLTIQANGREVHIFLNDVKIRTLAVPAHKVSAGFIGLRNHLGSRMVFRAPRLQRR